MHQTHSTNIKILNTPILEKSISYSNTDGLITTNPNHILIAKWADCLPIAIYHPHEILCVLHAGRRGTDSGILSHALDTLIAITNKKTGYHIWFGPHICESCYEINPNTNEHYSLIKHNLKQLSALIPQHLSTLYIHKTCTCCSTLFHSYRGNNKTKKRNYVFCSLR